ncbi:MAG: Maf family protein [Bacteroidales bacterium]|jgi:septum formation protein|nr:Maf family protein [Bacteroidales bacterium]
MYVNPSFPVYRIPLILASRSRRRIALLRQAGFRFTVCDTGIAEESYPTELRGVEVPLYLAERKSDAFLRRHVPEGNTVVVTADTVVCRHEQVLGKPACRKEAVGMLESLSAGMHRVYTGVCLASSAQRSLFSSESRVWFRKLSREEIEWYADAFRPYDKAGAYGIQEWIGLVGIEKIEGSYYNIVGFPIHRFYEELKKYEP